MASPFSLPSLMHAWDRTILAWRRWGQAREGNVAIVLGLCLLPMMGLVGLGADYYTGLSQKSRLDAAADAAAVAAISTSQAYISANSALAIDPFLTNAAIAAGKLQGAKVFNLNAGRTLLTVPATPTIQVARTGQTLTATVTYTGSMPSAFGPLYGQPTMTLGGTASSSLTMGSYLDFYLALDVSGSMGLPTSSAGQAQLASLSPDMKSDYPSGCAFACHFSGYQGFGLSRTNNIALRVDSVGKAVNNLIATATKTQTLTNQYRIGIYPFIVHAMEAAPLSSVYATASTVASTLANVYLDSGLSNPLTKSMGSGGTHFENLLPDMGNYIKVIGDGSGSTKPKPFLFLVTDGANNNQTYSPWTGSQPGRPNNFGYCQYAQQLGLTISILYIPYVPISPVNTAFAGNEDGKVNAVIPSIPGDLKACASPGYFFTANSDADINAAMQAMFAQALQAARLTQ